MQCNCPSDVDWQPSTAGPPQGCAPGFTLVPTVRPALSTPTPVQGFWEIVPRKLISIFNDHELELLISGLPEIDVDDLRTHTDYQGGLPCGGVQAGSRVSMMAGRPLSCMPSVEAGMA